MLSSSEGYFKMLEDILRGALSGADTVKNPLLEKRNKIRNTAICVFTSDTGLCGVYNHTILKFVDEFVSKIGREKVILFAAGKKGAAHFLKEGMKLRRMFPEMHGRYSYEAGQEMLKSLMDIFLTGEADEVYNLYAASKTSSRVVPKAEKFLNVEFRSEKRQEYIFDPNVNSVVSKILPEYLAQKIKIVTLNAFVSEHYARLTAMTKATDNARELSDSLIMLRNKVRQANITNELIDIISSAESVNK
jgi:F-type H+-transporting ATPase subunit gamma